MKGFHVYAEFLSVNTLRYRRGRYSSVVYSVMVQHFKGLSSFKRNCVICFFSKSIDKLISCACMCVNKCGCVGEVWYAEDVFYVCLQSCAYAFD